MLLELSIENLALFERASLGFGPGLNVISGETGAGKSLLIGALELLLGERPRSSLVRGGASEARVEGRFVLTLEKLRAPELDAWFASNLPELHEQWARLPAADERELILGRTLSSEGRTRAWIDHRPATQRTLRELTAHLVEIHGQHDHQSLFDTGEQRRLLDAFGGLAPLVAGYRAERARWMELAEQLRVLDTGARERRDRVELLRFQAGELAQARLSVDEHQALLDERGTLRHAGELGTQLGGIVGELAEAENAPLDALRRAQRLLEHWETKIAQLAGPAQGMREALVQLEESIAALARFLEGVEYSPERLEVVEQRLYQLELLERKYRCDIAGLVEREAEIQRELALLDDPAHSRAELEAAHTRAREALEAAAKKLTRARQTLKPKLAAAVRANFAELGLEHARFEVQIEAARAGASDSQRGAQPAQRVLPGDARAVDGSPAAPAGHFGPDGADDVEFLFSANPGQALQPLRTIVSGGECARIMLALRTALAVRHAIPTLVFDEVDAGVGGRLAPKVGEHLRALAGHHQILCVTHMPAIAARAHQHFRVEKRVLGGRTRTQVAQLAGDARVEEIADMIAGGAAHATARAEARRLLASS